MLDQNLPSRFCMLVHVSYVSEAQEKQETL